MRHHQQPASATWFLENLEPRLLLSASTDSPYLLAAPMTDDWTVYAGLVVDEPIGQSVFDDLGAGGFDGPVDRYLRGVQARIEALLAADPQADVTRASPSEYFARVTREGLVQIDAFVQEVTPAVLQGLKAAGLRVELSNPGMRVVEGWAHYSLLDDLAAVPGVGLVALPSYGMTNTGSVTSDGDWILKADDLRSAFGVSGQGVRVGVISNGIANWTDARDSGDLPTTLTYSALGTGDEGTAMLEIVYDLAPGADLYFHPASTAAQMTDAIDWLTDEGVDVIVDDLTFYLAGSGAGSQSYFTDGPSTAVAAAAQAAVDSGIVYVTCAGNWQLSDIWDSQSVKSHWQGQFSDPNADGWLDFVPGDRGNTFTLGGHQSLQVNLQWSDPWPGSANNYDLYLFNNNYTQVLWSSTLAQTGTQYPWEGWNITYNLDPPIVVNLAIGRVSGQARQLEMFVATAGPTGSHSSGLQYAEGDTLASQQAVEEVMTVGAVDAGDSGWDTVEPFSSWGPSRIYTDLGNTQSWISRQSLDMVAIDRVDTSIGGTVHFDNPFIGTSAAAPHVAALAALLLQVNPGLTPAGVSQALNATAVDLTAYGSGYDEASGWGRADGLGAAYKVYTPDTPDLQADSDTGISSTDNITMDTTPTFVGTVPAGSYVRLYVDDELEGTQDLGAQVTAYSITTAALAEGSHLVTVRLGVDSSTPTGNLSYESDELQIWIDTTAPTATISEISTPRSDAVQTAAIDFGESIGDFSVAALSLRRDGGSNLLTSSQTPTTTDQRHWTVPNLAGLTGRAGAYELKLTAAGSQITDVAGNPLAGDAVEEWLMDTITGTSGADTVTLSGSTAQVVTTSDSYAVDLGDFAEYPLNFKGGDGIDELTVDLINGNPVPEGGVAFDGEGGSDTLSIEGGTGNESVELGAGQATVNSGPAISYSSTETLTMTLGGGENNTVSIADDLGQVALMIYGEGGGKSILTCEDPDYADQVTLTLKESAARVEIDSTLKVDALVMEEGAAAKLTSGGSKVLYTKTLSIAETEGVPTARLDLTDNDLIVDYTGGTQGQPSAQLEAVKRWITAGYASMTWAGNGIVSTTAAAAPITYGLGYAQNDMFLFGPYEEFDGFDVDLSTILVKFTYNGDVNLDGCVDDNDVTILNLYYDGGATGGHYWHQGDIFLYDGLIDDNDVTILNLTYGSGWKWGPRL